MLFNAYARLDTFCRGEISLLKQQRRAAAVYKSESESDDL